ncbi:radA DNA repair protein [Pseudoscardovia radai]|uniref:DNA repair protein RadA n=1 Tax=Pseudoscardovia radai TaxID=987066 RepID=A0A261EZB8_9BIFI|nr:DNA repair protein RadA [Pseudoscardovia radai]OZG52173.1 radA DNA repair protein [Pseudoscardovia radai]
MAKSSVHYVCTDCGWSGVQWFGRCPVCGAWGTIEEFREAPSRTKTRTSAATSRAAAIAASRGARPVHAVSSTGAPASARSGGTSTAARGSDAAQRGETGVSATTSVSPTTGTPTAVPSAAQPDPAPFDDDADSRRLPTGFSEFDRVLGGGIVPGSIVLMAGEPGIGKSTLLLETASNVARQGQTVLYISGEESQSQVRMRARRIDATADTLFIASTTDLGTALDLIEENQPGLVIVDSVQTIYSADVDGIPGGSTQVREVTTALIDVAKRSSIPVLLVGHVTKDGSIAGPRTLEHLVDVVCQFEGEPQTALRLLRSVKNRFGPTDEVGCFDMSGEGIEEVRDPSGLFLSDGDDTPAGTCITFTMDGHRSLPIEVQALVTASVLPSPRRATNGVDQNRLAMIVAVIYRHAKINLLANDLYVSTIAGGSAREPADDLAIAAALASAATDCPIARTTAAFGEISLTGQIRPVPRLESRLREAARLGYKKAVVPRNRRYDGRKPIPGIELVEVATLADALHALGVDRKRRSGKGAGAEEKA